MKNSCPIVLLFVASVSLPSCKSHTVRTEVIALSQAHAHNDYSHNRPLYDALAHGFNSVEADIFLVDDGLYVAHDRQDITHDRTLRSLYLDPLRERIRQNNGRVHLNGPQFTLLIDIKSDAVSTYKRLDGILAEYRDIFTSFGLKGRRDGAVVAIISGNRPYDLMKSQQVRYAGYDGRLADLESSAPADLIPMISDNWTRHFTWNGAGKMLAEERRKLREIVQTAHKKGRRVRFWATPDNPSPEREAVWRELISAGTDVLNTDDLEGLQQFLLADRPE